MKRITLKKARIIADMTEVEVCTALRIRKDQLQAWERGKSVPSNEHASALASAYEIPIDFLDFSKEVNTPPAPRKLTLEEIEALPFASVIWISSTDNDNGVIWHWKSPVVVGAPGRYGVLVGGAESSIIYREISEKTFADPSETYWTQEPDDSQIQGITEAEYNHGPDAGHIIHQKLAEAITGRKLTFTRFCEQVGLDFDSFWSMMTGKRDPAASELLKIAESLNTTVDDLFIRK